MNNLFIIPIVFAATGILSMGIYKVLSKRYGKTTKNASVIQKNISFSLLKKFLFVNFTSNKGEILNNTDNIIDGLMLPVGLTVAKKEVKRINIKFKPDGTNSKILKSVELPTPQKPINLEYLSSKNKNHRFGHTVVVGQSGSGKTERFFKPTLIFNALSKNKPSMIINDLKPTEIKTNGSLYSAHKLFLEKLGYKVVRINLESDSYNQYYAAVPEDKYQKIPSHKFNPLDMLWDSKDDPDALKDNILALSNQLFADDPGEKNPFWNNTSRLILQAGITFMIEQNFPKKYFTLKTLNIIFEQEWETFIKMAHDASPAAQAILQSFTSKKDLGDIFINFKTKWMNYISGILLNVSETTNCETNLRSKPTAVFIQNQAAEDKEHINAFANIILRQFIAKNLTVPGKDIIVLLDEFGNFPYLKEMSNWISTTRSKGIHWIIGVQGLEQLDRKYKTQNMFLDNIQNLYLFGTDNSQEMEKYFDNFSEIETKRNISMDSEGDLRGHSHSQVSQTKLQGNMYKIAHKDFNGLLHRKGEYPFRIKIDGAWEYQRNLLGQGKKTPTLQSLNISKINQHNDFSLKKAVHYPKVGIIWWFDKPENKVKVYKALVIVTQKKLQELDPNELPVEYASTTKQLDKYKKIIKVLSNPIKKKEASHVH